MDANFLRETLNLDSSAIDVDGELKFSTDSRKLNGANAFICLYGDNFDAFSFVEELVDTQLKIVFYEEKEGRASIVEKIKSENSGAPDFIGMENIFNFLSNLGALAAEEFKRCGGKIIGLTGSNGKTTNKEMLAWILDGLAPGEVLWTLGNLNNHIGVPLTLLRLNSNYKYAIVEMGTNHPGEILGLAEIARPNYGLITNIGHAHLEYLIDLEGVFKEKTALYEVVEQEKEGFIIINEMDNYLKKYQEKCSSFRINSKNFKISKLANESSFELEVQAEKVLVTNSTLLGDHQKTNMAQCLSLCLHLFPDKLDKISSLANSFQMPSMNRGELLTVAQKKVFLDAYNANPDSMRASLNSFLELLSSENGKLEDCLFILGDMNELGQMGKDEHIKLGKHLKELGAKSALFVGKYSSFYQSGFGGGDICVNFKEAQVIFEKSAAPFTFIKGSRSLQLESILDIKGV